MITTRNTNTAMYSVYEYIVQNCVHEGSRNGPVLSVPHPVTIQYTHPQEQVNFCPARDANPFFHFIEKLWFLEARGDTDLICQYLPGMMAYSDDGTTFNAHYGYNARVFFSIDQLKEVAKVLRENPTSRQAVVQIWNPQDLISVTKDKACNMQLVFRIVGGWLNMTVYNRSNDAILGGVSGANITNLFVFQEYVAAFAGYPIGYQFIVSNNLHLYLGHPKTEPILEKYTGMTVETAQRGFKNDLYTRGSVHPTTMITDPDTFDVDLAIFMMHIRNMDFVVDQEYRNPFFTNTATPLVKAFWLYKDRDIKWAISVAGTIAASDWRLACLNWLERRLK